MRDRGAGVRRFGRAITPRPGQAAAGLVLLALLAIVPTARPGDPPPAGASAESLATATGSEPAAASVAAPATVPATVLIAAPTAPASVKVNARPQTSTPAPPAAVVAAPSRVSSAPDSPPATLNDLDAWLAYAARHHIASLPQEARVFYRRGLLVHQAGSAEEAIRLVHGAAELDPEFVAPHLTLASWFVIRDPSQSLLQYAAVIQMVRESFVIQLAMLANAVYVLVQALFLGFLAAGFLIVWIHNSEFRHMWSERLSSFISPRTAQLWAWGFLLFPFALGFGIALPTLALLGLMWPVLRARERLVFILLAVMIAGAPWITRGFGRFSAPQRSDHGPLFGIPALANEPFTPEREQELQKLAAQHFNNAYAQFALGWEARRGGDLEIAEAAYRRALELWPNNDRVMNNLGNTLAMQGHPDEALELYQRATSTNPRNAAAFFNASQIFTQRFEYKPATDALTRASALNFDLVKSYQTRGTDDGLLPLVDQWLSPVTFWAAVTAGRVEDLGKNGLPPGWRSRLETSGWQFSVIALIVALAAALLGAAQHGRAPLRTCNNCDAVICRRCAQRRRETALCAACAAVESRAESPDFARVLLSQHRRGVVRGRELLRTAFATWIPGFGLLAMGRMLRPVFLLILTAALVGPWIGLEAPFSYEPRLNVATREMPVAVLVTLWILIYASSLLGYFSMVGHQRRREADMKAPVKSRNLTTNPRRTAAAA